MATWLYDRSSLHAPRSRQKVRLALSLPSQGGANPFLLEVGDGLSYWLTAQDGAIRVRASYAGGPPWFQVSVPVTEGASNPRLAREPMGRLVLVYATSEGTWYTASGDLSRSFETPTMAIPGGTKPTVMSSNDGQLYVAAIVDGVLKARLQEPGDVALGDLFTLQYWTGTALADLAVEDDTFHLMQEWGPAARYWLHCVPSGETDTAAFSSGDRGKTWQRASN